MAKNRTLWQTWRAALVVGLVIGLVCFFVLRAHNQANPAVQAADYQRSLDDARDLLSGQDPYRRAPGPYAIPYPLPAGISAIPLAWLPNVVAASVFFGISAALLTFGFLRAGEQWRIAMFFSWSFVYALLWVQWTPLICALWYLPAAAALVLIKPHIALPALLVGEFRRRALAGQWRWLVPPAALLLVSLVWYPTWPLVWLRQIGTYQGISPPLFSLPLGPLVLLSLAAWRDRRAWLLVILALMPQRMVYDQLPILLVAATPRQLWILVAASWANCAVFLQSDGWSHVPLGWQNFLLATLYLPAVAMVAWPSVREMLGSKPALMRPGHAPGRT